MIALKVTPVILSAYRNGRSTATAELFWNRCSILECIDNSSIIIIQQQLHAVDVSELPMLLR